MVKRILFFLFVFCFIYPLKLEGQPEPTGRRLREIVADKYGDSIIIGATTGAWLLNANTGEILDREFSYVTPENDFKQWNIHPDNSSGWNWIQTDAWAAHIVTNDQILRMHCPIGPQCSNWAKDDSRTAAELDTLMCQFMRAVCQRYNGVIGFVSLDVVNETVNGGSWHTNKPGIVWECPWYIIGQDTDPNNTPLYIKKAFEIADSLAPDLKLIYNHHEHPENTASWNLIKETIQYLRDNNLRVDGIGWQAHVDVGWESEATLNALRNLIDWAHSNNLEFHVTEASVWLDGPSEENFEEQAVTYRAILDVLLGKRFTGKVGWNTWNIDDNYGWYTEHQPPNLYPSLFDSNYAAKPAYYAVQAALEGLSGIDEPEKDISAFKLYNNPNPFVSTTSISFGLPLKSHVNLKVYNLSGQEISTLVTGDMETGRHTVEWNASGLPAGIYFCHMVAGDFVGKQKMMLVK